MLFPFIVSQRLQYEPNSDEWVSPTLHEWVELRREGGTVYEMECWNESIPSIAHNEFRVNKLYVTVSEMSDSSVVCQ